MSRGVQRSLPASLDSGLDLTRITAAGFFPTDRRDVVPKLPAVE